MALRPAGPARSDRPVAGRPHGGGSALRPLLPAGTTLASTETEEAQGSALSRAYRVNLDMLALVAL